MLCVWTGNAAVLRFACTAKVNNTRVTTMTPVHVGHNMENRRQASTVPLLPIANSLCAAGMDMLGGCLATCTDAHAEVKGIDLHRLGVFLSFRSLLKAFTFTLLYPSATFNGGPKSEQQFIRCTPLRFLIKSSQHTCWAGIRITQSCVRA